MFYPSSLFNFPDRYRTKAYFSKIFIMALVYYFAGILSLSVSNENNIVTIVIFAAEGFALAAVLLFGRSIWPGIFIGQFLLALNQDISLLPSLGIAMVNTLEALLAWKIFRYFGFNKDLKSAKDLFGLFFMIAFFLQPFSAFFGTLILYSASIVDSHEYLNTLFSWWFGNTLGQMLWTPMLLLLYANRRNLHIFEFLLTGFFFILLAYLIFMVLPVSNLSIIILITLPLSIYIAIKKGLLCASVMIGILSLVSIYATYRNVGIFSSMSMMDNIINLNFYILSHILIVLGVGALYTEAKEAKEALKKLNLSLESEIKTQVETLNRQNILMIQQAKLASMGEMLGMIAHQWRQPLNRINSNIAVLNSVIEEKDFDNPMLKKKLENIKTQTRFMSDTIEDFSSFFHPDKKAKYFQPYILVQKALTLIDIKNQQVSARLQGDTDIKVLSYKNEYLQVILSILHNAIENFAVTHTTDPLLDIVLKEDDTHTILSIQDNGGGIRHEKIETIFDPFVTTNQSGKNSGLGLYMAKLLIEESMHGTLDVSNRNGGACFTITLPKGGSYA
ncbi:MASE1 domain-containing protein [Sulfurovum riftiae]|uniref:histidine kinase n=1 Tax=Sulfurovum riftiae TaxID=1630136 RepID=A0A151CG69_9BACT|nr:MASE1 domain-containing protein [Sulfurovum riftiae]KYJ86479.1 hypothetical protein AS592_06645 [Sulfurovum riftiae]